MSLISAARTASRVVPWLATNDPGANRDAPELVTLAAENPPANPKPPVRIFVGTEPGQYRAQRIFLWSIEQVRDRQRTYEIYLMKDLRGFDRRGWLTGFTNYRFAIPHFCQGQGRAIYNDVDQIYLRDPAEMFDTDMGDHAFLSINDHDTSVMLIDCERMQHVWTLEAARQKRRKPLEAIARAQPQGWGQLDGGWNARDGEYHPDTSKLIHYTTIHTQPWRPFPDQYAYQESPASEVWNELERSADQAGYSMFTFARPSGSFSQTASRLCVRAGGTTAPSSATAALAEAQAFTDEQGAKDGLRILLGPEPATSVAPEWTEYDPLSPTAQTPANQEYDAVVCTNGLEAFPDDDVRWMIEEMFAYARRCVWIGVTDAAPETADDASAPQQRNANWWSSVIEGVSSRRPGIEWQLRYQPSGTEASTTPAAKIVNGGRPLPKDPSVWVLTNHKPGHTTQSIGMVRALGWDYELKPLRFTPLSFLTDRLLGRPDLDASGERAATLAPPWPDVVVATGWHTVPVAKWIKQQGKGRTRLLQLGRKGANVADDFDAAVTCEHFRLPPHPHRIQTLAPLNQVAPEQLEEASARWPDLMSDARGPRIVLLVGGTTPQHRFNRTVAEKLGDEVRRFAEAVSGTVYAVTSRRTGSTATEALAEALGPSAHLHTWRADRTENPYLAYLAGADYLVATGDSESMLAEAAAVGKPLYIYPLPSRKRGPVAALSEWVTQKAYSRPTKRNKGTVVPQRGLVYLCARIIEQGWLHPPRRLEVLYDRLVEHDYARRFEVEGPDPDWKPAERLHEADRVATAVRKLLGG